MNENKEKVVDNKIKTSSKGAKTVSNPLSKQMNALKKPVLKTPVKPAKNEEKAVSNPILEETSSIVARINNFNTNKTSTLDCFI